MSLMLPSQNLCFIQLIRSCKKLESLLQIHAQIFTGGLESNDSLRALLLNSYSSFSRHDCSLSVFNSSPNPSIALWNSMIRAHTRSGNHKEAIRLYLRMLQGGVQPDKRTFTFALKACSAKLDLVAGILIHSHIVKRKLQSDAYIGTTLIDMYCRAGMVSTASQLFDEMPYCDAVPWNAMIGGLSQNNHPYRALALFQKMPCAGIAPSEVTILNLFPAVCELSHALLCRSLHAFITRRLLLPALDNGLVDAYSKCGLVEAARRVFDGLMGDTKDDVSWATMISGYLYNGRFADALDLFNELRRDGMELNQVSVLSALSAAAETQDLVKGIEIHALAVERGMEFDISVTTVLAAMYAKCGEAAKAKLLFDEMPEKDIVAWSALISAFAQSGQPEEAASIFTKMIAEGIIPNEITVASALAACADMLELKAGKSLHCFALKSRISFDGSAGTAFVAMYIQCGSFVASHNVFDRLKNKDVVSWNALINGYAQIGDAGNAAKLFRDLRLAGLRPDRGTLVGMLSAFAILDESFRRARACAWALYGLVVKSGSGSDPHVKNAAMDMYAKRGSLDAAEAIFLETESREDVIAWNTMIAGYMHNGLANEAVFTFCRMRDEDIMPNLVTLVSIIPAAGCLPSLRIGSTLHCVAVHTSFASRMLVGNSLIDMYSKCGRIDLARSLFDLMGCKDVVSWNAMISGYAMHGNGEDAIGLFLRMKRSGGIRPDSASLVSVLSACRNAGMVEDGRKFLGSMWSELSVEPNASHYACVIDSLGRAGRFEEAWELIGAMPEAADACGVWGALLGAAKMHSNVKMGELAVERLVKLEPQNPSHYVILASIYADLGRWADAGRIRATIRSMGVGKSPGCSWV